MPCNSGLFTLFMIVNVVTVASDTLPINWNISTDLDHSRNERLYEYPMFTEVAPVPCDLTPDFCDFGCCLDPDCSLQQKMAFNCFEISVSKSCARPFALYDCNCNIDKQFWFPVLCYVFENPIYLGMFYKTQTKIEKLKDFSDRTNSSAFSVTVKSPKSYTFGSKIQAYVIQNGTYIPYPHAVFHDNSMIRGLSLDCNMPARYLVNSNNNCYVRLTKDLCVKGNNLSAKSYLLRNFNSTESLDLPVLYKNLETQKTAEVFVSFMYKSSSHIVKKFNRKLFKYYFLHGDQKQYSYSKDLFHTYLNGSVCHNVIAEAKFNFTVDGHEILSVEIEIILTNVSLVSTNSELIYLHKMHNISFNFVSVKSESESYLINRGYFVGEELNVGYKRNNGTQWEKGYMKIYLNGGVCNKTTDIFFGYNTYARCTHKSSTKNCSALRQEIEERLDYLINGTFAAPYGNYKDGKIPAVPILRDYNASQWENYTGCPIPTQQDVIIQYTTVKADRYTPIHRVVGVMVNRTYNNISLPSQLSVFLSFRVLFIPVSDAMEKPVSRFWQKILSPELSANAWLNLFRIVDDPNFDGHPMESAFWFFVLLASVGCFAILQLNC